jgi:hypothetical protein
MEFRSFVIGVRAEAEVRASPQLAFMKKSISVNKKLVVAPRRREASIP